MSRPRSSADVRGKPPVSVSGGRFGPNISSSSSSDGRRLVVGQYMIGKTIGEGTFGKVRLAVHIPTGEKVAIKILEKSKIKDQADVRRVNREIKILKKARHGNIIQLYEVLDTKATIYLIMECAEGGEMFDFIVAQKRVPEQQACKFLHQIVDGLETLHKHEITHRDLKPENLLLKASADGWIVKIVDFGLSNTHEGGKLLVTACGSPCYAAPEMIAGKKYFGPLADLWSLGVILFALVSGYLPFEDPNTSVLYKKILGCDYTTPRWISAEVRDLINCILEVDPRKRFTIDSIRSHPWYNTVSEELIPRDSAVHKHDTHSDTLAAIEKAGLNPQTVLDSLASHAFNSLTAMYYLLEQKHQALAAATMLSKKGIATSKTTIRQNSSSLSKSSHPETTSSDPPVEASSSGGGDFAADSVPSRSEVPVPSGLIVMAGAQTDRPIAAQDGPPSVTAPSNRIAAVPNPQVQQNSSPPKSAGGSSFRAAPYLQTPVIMQQHGHRQSQQQPSGRGSQMMPSLDVYLKHNMTVLPEQQHHHSSLNGGRGVAGHASKPPPTVGSNKDGRPEIAMIPALNLSKVKSVHNTTMTSQTTRQDAVAAGSITGGQSQSARAAIPPVIGMDSEVIERPNTRRSHVRSRGADEIAPGTGLEAVPSAATTTATAKVVDQSTVLSRPLDPTAPPGDVRPSVKTRLYVRPAPLVAQQRLYGGHQGSGTTTSAAPPATARLQAPDAPRTSIGFSGGRGGRNISSVANPAVAIQTGRYAAASSSSSSTKGSIIVDQLRKPNPPVAANEIMKPTQ